jgi:ankyrin repeat protein
MGDQGDKENPFEYNAAKMKAPHDGPPMQDAHFLRGTTPMHKAATLLNFEEVDKLLAAGSDDIDTGDVLNQTPLILLARCHYKPEDIPKAVQMVNKVIAAGATLVMEDGKIRRDDYGDSVLHLAAMATCKNGPGILKALVDALPAETKGKLCGARCKNFGNTTLHWATLSGDMDSCQLLIDAGCPLDRKNRLKETILDYAVKYEHIKLKVKYEALMASK